MPDSTYNPLYGISSVSSPLLGEVDNTIPLNDTTPLFDYKASADNGYVDTFGFLHCMATVESSQ